MITHSSSHNRAPESALPIRRIVQTWWPLALGWILMTIEMPVLTSVIARQPSQLVS